MRNPYKIAVITAAMMLFCHSLFAQNAVTGTVTDINGEPIPGVSVAVLSNSTLTGTVTDMDGKYSVNAPTTGQLAFSSIGYVSQTVNIMNRAVINVTLADDLKILDESVVVGFATQKKNQPYRFRCHGRFQTT